MKSHSHISTVRLAIKPHPPVRIQRAPPFLPRPPTMSANEYSKEKAPSVGSVNHAQVYGEDTIPDHALVRQLKCMSSLSLVVLLLLLFMFISPSSETHCHDFHWRCYRHW